MIIWHVVHWHSTGMYTRLSELIGEGKGYLTALYNLGLIIVSSTVLGILMNRITDLLTREELHPGDDTSGEKREED